MKKRVIVLKNADMKKFMDVKGYIEMRLSTIGKLMMDYTVVGESYECVLFNVWTSKKMFEELKTELSEFFPGCMYLEQKGEVTA